MNVQSANVSTQRKVSIGVASALAIVCALLPQSMVLATAVSNDTEWRFNVLLDDNPIGHHSFLLQSTEDRRALKSEARFNVKFLFFNAYRYVHDNNEIWSGDCLTHIDARTDDNGKRQAVQGSEEGGRFVVHAGQRSQPLDACVMTFAYWNPQILTAKKLLNPQTGEYVPVQIERIASETLSVRGQAVAANRYRIIGHAANDEHMQIDVWYSQNEQWLALESVTNGRRLRYQIQ